MNHLLESNKATDNIHYMTRKFKYVVYKLTFPNDKIYIGMDIGLGGHSLRYFGSWNNELVEADFTKEELSDFTLRKQVIFESDDKGEIRKKENELIRRHRSNNPNIGYNRTLIRNTQKKASS